MLKPLTLLALALAMSCSWAAEDEPPKLPLGAQAIIDNAKRVITRNRAAYDEANERSLAEAEKALKAEQDKLAKAGRLEDALAIKKLMEVFRDDLVAKVDAKAREKVDLLGDPIAPRAIVGTWKLVYSNPRRTERVMVVSNDLSVAVTGGAGAGSSYVLEYDDQRKLYVGHFSPDKGKPETYRIVNGKLEVRHWSDGGDWKTISPTFTAVGTRE